MKVTESTVTGTVAYGFAQAGLTMKQRLHGTVFNENSVLGRTVPVNLPVEIVAIQTLRSRLEIVGRVARSGYVWQRNQSQDLCGNGINRDGRLVSKGCASSTICIPSSRVIDGRARAGKIPGAKSRGGDRYKTCAAVIALISAIVASEEE